MTGTPPWASGRSDGGFSRPDTTSSPSFTPPVTPRTEPRGAKSAPAAQRRHPTRGHRLITVLLAMVVVVLVAAAAALTWKAFTPEDVSAPLPAVEFSKPAEAVRSKAVGPNGTDPVALEDGGTGPGGATTVSTTTMGPNTLFVPALGVYMPLEADSTFVASRYAGFDTIEVPANPRHGAWYAGGAPLHGGKAGTTLIASHVSQASGWGALRYLYTLKGGELLYTKDGKGELQTWQMTQMRVEEHTHFPQQYWSPKGIRQLVVTTCGGSVHGGHYDKNIFAIATPVDPAPGADSDNGGKE